MFMNAEKYFHQNEIFKPFLCSRTLFPFAMQGNPEQLVCYTLHLKSCINIAKVECDYPPCGVCTAPSKSRQPVKTLS